jgi:hypothetical protein
MASLRSDAPLRQCATIDQREEKPQQEPIITLRDDQAMVKIGCKGQEFFCWISA